jgi:hypothetical protein
MLEPITDLHSVVEIPVRQLTRFLKFIAEHDLWDELEQHLHDRSCDKLLMSWEPVEAVAKIVEARSAKLATTRRTGATVSLHGTAAETIRCDCKGPRHKKGS